MISALTRRLGPVWLAITLTALIACGGGGEKAEAPACPTCPVCSATPSPAPLNLSDLVDKLTEKNFKKFRTTPEAFKAAVTQFGIADKIGKKEVSPEEFAKWVDFFWAMDPEFRILYLRAMMTHNRLIDMMQPAVGKFDITVAPKDPEAEDISLLISQSIVDWAQVQRVLEDDFMGMGVENVMGVKPSDDMPHAEAMMKDLLAIVAPPGAPAASPLPSPGPKSASRGLLSLLEGNAWAQQLPVATKTTKTGTAGVKVSKAVPRVKVKQAPFLLARVISFNVGGRNFVPQSALMAAIPEFQAVPVEQFQFKLEKMSVGPAYRDAVDAKVQELAAKPQRDMVDWFVLSHGLNELRLLNQLVDFSKVAPQPLAPAGGGTSTAPGALPTSGGITAAPSAAGGTTERPFAPSGAEARPNATELRPGLPGAAAPSEAGAPTRPDQPSALAPAASPPKTELPSGAPKTEAPSAVPKSAPPSGTQPGPAAP